MSEIVNTKISVFTRMYMGVYHPPFIRCLPNVNVKSIIWVCLCEGEREGRREGRKEVERGIDSCKVNLVIEGEGGREGEGEREIVSYFHSSMMSHVHVHTVMYMQHSVIVHRPSQAIPVCMCVFA